MCCAAAHAYRSCARARHQRVTTSPVSRSDSIHLVRNSVSPLQTETVDLAFQHSNACAGVEIGLLANVESITPR